MTKIVEMMPDNLSNELVAAIAEGRLCRYAQELEMKIVSLEKKLRANDENRRES